ncbi:MAG: ABC transporter substrate-binding protein [Sulfurimonas sp.]
MIKIVRVLVLLLLCSSFAAAKELRPITLQLQWKYQFEFAGYIVAKEKGLYRDAGLDVTIKEWQPGIKMVDEVIAKRSEYAVVRPTSLIDVVQGKEIVYLATIFQSSPLILLADKSSGIKRIKDFRNKRIMTTGDHNADSSLLSMMFSQGVKLEDLEMQVPSFNPRDLLDKKTDLMASYISNEPYVLKEMGGDPVIFSPKDYGFDFYNDLLITSKEHLIDHP